MVEMRKANEKVLDSGIYARLREMRLSDTERRDAVAALLRAEQIALGIMWVKQKATEVGHLFLRPSLKH